MGTRVGGGAGGQQARAPFPQPASPRQQQPRSGARPLPRSAPAAAAKRLEPHPSSASSSRNRILPQLSVGASRQGPPSTMVKLGCSFSGKSGKDPGDQDEATTDSVPLISPLDVSQLQPPFSDQVVIKTQTEYELTSMDQPKKFPDLEAQKLACSHSEEGRRLPTARMIAFAMALMGCVLIMYKAIWYDQFTCPDGFLLRHKMCTPLTLEMYYTEMDPERHRSILAAIGAYPLSRKHGTEPPSAWVKSHRMAKEGPKAPTQAGTAATAEPPGKSVAPEEEAERKAAGSVPPPAAQ